MYEEIKFALLIRGKFSTHLYYTQIKQNTLFVKPVKTKFDKKPGFKRVSYIIYLEQAR